MNVPKSKAKAARRSARSAKGRGEEVLLSQRFILNQHPQRVPAVHGFPFICIATALHEHCICRSMPGFFPRILVLQKKIGGGESVGPC
jgi:hypothetical protein